MTAEPDVEPLVKAIAASRRQTPAARAVLAALSGIDGSGKGYVARRVADILGRAGLAVALINIDGWLNLPSRRFAEVDPAGHFYRHAIRFEELFARLLLPLTAERSILVEADFAAETATDFRRHVYEFTAVDVVLVEGIFLFKRAWRPHYDVAAWLECSFQTALARAVARAQEGLSPDATAAAYHRIYFPAQRLHFARDRPAEGADLRILNG